MSALAAPVESEGWLDFQVFLQTLDPGAEWFHFQPVAEGHDAREKEGLRPLQLPNTRQTYDQLLEINRQGYAILVALQETKVGEKATRENITRYRVVIQDQDEPSEVAYPLLPSMEVETSPGRFHRYWLVSDEQMTREHFDQVSRALVEGYEHDRNFSSPFIRVPGFLHQKTEDKHQVRLTTVRRNTYTTEEMLKAFPNSHKRVEPPKIGEKNDFDRPTSTLVLSEILSFIPSDDRQDWFKVACALHEEFGGTQHGLELFDEWSSTSKTNYDEKAVRELWGSLDRGYAGEPVTIGTLFWMAQKNGWHPKPTPYKADDLQAILGEHSYPIADKAVADLMDYSRRVNHTPNEEFQKGFREIGMVIESALNGRAPDALYLSALPPGAGKSMTLAFMVKAALEADEKASFLIFADRHEELQRFVHTFEDIGVPKDEIAFLTGEQKELDDFIRARQCRVVLTTKKKLEWLYIRTGKPIEEMSEYFYIDAPRKCRVWDETYNSVNAVSIDDDSLMGVIHFLKWKQDFRFYQQELKGFVLGLRQFEDGSVHDFPSCEVRFDDWTEMFPQALQTAAAQVHHLMGKQVKVTKKNIDSAFITYTRKIPQDMTPMLVLDASGKHLETYRQINGLNDKRVVYLTSPEKDYTGATIHYSNRSAGRDARNNQKTMEGIARDTAETINRVVENGKKALVLYHKQSDDKLNLQVLMTKHLNPDKDVRFLTWGNHTATNEFHDCHYVFMIGLFIQPRSYYEATAMGIRDIPLEDSVDRGTIDAVAKGEILHHAYQGACRGLIRKLNGNRCPSDVHLYTMFTQNSLHYDDFYGLFPGAKRSVWATELTANEHKAFEAIVDEVSTWNNKSEAIYGSGQLAELMRIRKDDLRRVATENGPLVQFLRQECIQLDKVKHGTYKLAVGHTTGVMLHDDVQRRSLALK